MIIKARLPKRKVRHGSYEKYVLEILACKEGEAAKVDISKLSLFHKRRIVVNVRGALESRGYRLISRTDLVGNLYFWRGEKIDSENQG